MTCAPDAFLRLFPGESNRRGKWLMAEAAGHGGPGDSWHRKRSRRLAESRGAVTAEFAVTLPAVLLLLAMLLAGAAAGVTQLRLEEGARAGARALARGDDSAAVERIVRTLSGASASAAVATEGEWLSVTVTDRVGGPLGASIPWTLTARASTRSEKAIASSHARLAAGVGPSAG